MITVVTGGIKSGKSFWAQSQGESINGSRAFIATALPLDEEMQERIKKHQAERAHKWTTFEEAKDIVTLLEDVTISFDIVLLDCLTMWLSNLLTVYNLSTAVVQQKSDELIACLAGRKSHVIIVTNEVGMGIIPADPLSRSFQSLLGRLNMEVAGVADAVYMMVSGIPLRMKNGNLSQ
jgi:adenosylcobinamide kinase/adenosylcobinamide-phosphate guanylyltransferase